MRSFLSRLISIIFVFVAALICCSLLSVCYADDEGVCDGVPWRITGSELLIGEANGDFSFDAKDNRTVNDYPWSYNEEITSVKFLGKVHGNGSAAYMFYGCSSIVSVDLTNFDSGGVTDMRLMFGKCAKIKDLDLSMLDTSLVRDMSSMFYCCEGLKSVKMNGIDTSNVTDASYMFYECKAIKNVDLSSLDFGKVVKMSFAFNNCTSVESILLPKKISSDLSEVRGMFAMCSRLQSLDISALSTANVKDMSYMFFECNMIKELDLSGFVTCNVTNMKDMFYMCVSIQELDISGFDMSNVSDMEKMFYGCRDLQGIVLGEKTRLYGNCSFPSLYIRQYMTLDKIPVKDADKIEYYGYDGSCPGWYYCVIYNLGIYDGVPWEIIENCLYIGYSGESYTFDYKKVRTYGDYPWTDNMNIEYVFFNGNVSGNGSMGCMFGGLESLLAVDLTGFCTDNVTDMSDMFDGCYELNYIDGLSELNTSKVTDMSGMFADCRMLKYLDLSDFDTRQVGYMSGMFYGCKSLVSLDISSFDTSIAMNEGNTELMFTGCYAIDSIKLGSKTLLSEKLPYDGWYQLSISETPGSITNLSEYTGDKPGWYINNDLFKTLTIEGLSDKTYTGSAITQTPVLRYNDEKLLPEEDYVVSEWINNINVGTATATITGIGWFTGSRTISFKITQANDPPHADNNSARGGSDSQVISQNEVVNLPAVKILKPKASKKALTVKWKKLSKENLKKIKKIEIQYSTDSSFTTDVRSVFINAKKTSKKITKLTKGMKYYVRIRAYTASGSVVNVSNWSGVKSAKVK